MWINPLITNNSSKELHESIDIKSSNQKSWQILLAVVSLLSIHAGLIAWASFQHSPTFNEPGHLVAGLSQLQFGRFELYRVNPPLVRMVAALPVLAVGCETDWSGFHEYPGARPVFGIGPAFMKANGDRSLWLFTIARWACLPFSLLGGYICFRWARELYGPLAGLLAVSLWCFSPNIIAHGQLITADCGAAAFGVTAAYFFWRWLKSPSWGRVFVAGITLGLAELTKTSWLILFGLWPMLWIVWLLSQSETRRSAATWLRQGGQLLATLGIAIYVLNLGYGFEGSFTKLSDYTFVSETLSGSETDKPTPGNRFSNTWLSEIPMPVPKNYLMGIDVQKRDFEDFGRPSYLRGEFSERGWWYYYLYAAAIKIPLGTWLLAGLCVWLRVRSRPVCHLWRDEIVLLLPAVVLFTLVSSQTGFSHHFRYVLPVFPFAFIWISRIASAALAKGRFIIAVSVIAFVWSVGSSLWVYPHSLSYFNELAGGPTGGHNHLINSNIDWGQDLLNLKRWMDTHPEAKSLHLAYYGYYDPKHVGIHTLPVPQRPPDSISRSDPKPLEPGWYAVSVSYLRGYPWAAPQDAYSYFQQFEPVAMAGYSIYIYHITTEEANRVRRELGLPKLDATKAISPVVTSRTLPEQ